MGDFAGLCLAVLRIPKISTRLETGWSTPVYMGITLVAMLWLNALKTRSGRGERCFVKVRKASQILHFKRRCGLRVKSRSKKAVIRNILFKSLLFVLGSSCGIPPLQSGVIATPTKDTYGIGERVSLSCPAGSALEGEVPEVICNPSLQWSPSPASASCSAGKEHIYHSDSVLYQPCSLRITKSLWQTSSDKPTNKRVRRAVEKLALLEMERFFSKQVF